MSQVQAGTLLVATPALSDPNFVDAVVLLLDVDEDGILGVVVNRPTGVPVGEPFTGWGGVVSAPGVLFEGGPVESDAALALGMLRDPGEVPAGFRSVTGRLGLLDLGTPGGVVDPTVSAARIFAGYAGWGLQQLVDEIAEGAWYVLDSEPEDAFRSRTESLWSDVLRRQPGELAWHSTRPADPELN